MLDRNTTVFSSVTKSSFVSQTCIEAQVKFVDSSLHSYTYAKDLLLKIFRLIARLVFLPHNSASSQKTLETWWRRPIFRQKKLSNQNQQNFFQPAKEYGRYQLNFVSKFSPILKGLFCSKIESWLSQPNFPISLAVVVFQATEMREMSCT